MMERLMIAKAHGRHIGETIFFDTRYGNVRASCESVTSLCVSEILNN